ncbi:MAG: potassium transporter Kup [Desulfarculus sp.]|nr:potassium transporter Kup [Desulfarculus sp.]
MNHPAPSNQANPSRQAGLAGMSLAALGVVYGDIGTSPLYAIKECFHGLHAIAVDQTNVLGVLSLVFWSLTVVVTVKYVAFILLADNRGEGGIFALLALLSKDRQSPGRKNTLIAIAAVFGAALLYGDGIITPAISVLSAIEGLEVATQAAKPAVLPLTCAVLLGLFLVQRHGTAGIGRVFGPIMVLWFFTIATLGLMEIVKHPQVLAALNPVHAVRFFALHHLHGLVVLASVVLCITGGEALYADMGHFGRQAIRLSWFVMVYPALLINYFGQGALLLSQPALAVNPFYGLVPTPLLYPMVALSTMATVIASQAMISGVFSLTQQAVQLGYSPRLHVVHTSEATEGQIFVPGANYGLMVACLALVLTFQESSRLAGAYGIAVTATMGITSVLYFFVVRRIWGWSLWRAAPLVVLFLAFDATYFGANLLKVLDGGWFTLLVGLLITLAMTTWMAGRQTLGKQMRGSRLPIEAFLKEVAQVAPHRVPGTAVFLTLSAQGTPVTLLHHFKLNKVLHEKVVFLTMLSADVPTVPEAERLQLEDLGQGFYRLLAWHGFMETPNVPRILRRASKLGLLLDPLTATYFLGRETLLTSGKSGLSRWRKNLFAFMSRNASNPAVFFDIPPHRVIEIGMQVAL